MPDDTSKFQELAEKCFSIKPQLRSPRVESAFASDFMPINDTLAAWALLCDLQPVQLRQAPDGWVCFRGVSNLGYRWSVGSTPHEAVARCWLAANGQGVE